MPLTRGHGQPERSPLSYVIHHYFICLSSSSTEHYIISFEAELTRASHAYFFLKGIVKVSQVRGDLD